MVGGGLFLSPTVAEKSPTPARKSPTPAEKVQLQSQNGVGLWNIPVNLSSQVHLWSSGLWMLEEYYDYTKPHLLTEANKLLKEEGVRLEYVQGDCVTHSLFLLAHGVLCEADLLYTHQVFLS